jgi:hypothetical protein
LNPAIVGIAIFDTMLATVSALAGFLAGRMLRTNLRAQRIKRGLICLVLAPMTLGLIELIGRTGWEDEALGAVLFTVPLLFVTGTFLVAGLFLLLCGPRKVLS